MPKQIDNILVSMRKSGKMQDMSAKGDLGEDAVLYLCYERKQQLGNGLLYQSFMYPYQTNRSGVCYTGNIKYIDNEFVEVTREGLNDEIDVLYITPYRVFPIEVKSYGNTRLDIYDHRFNHGNKPVDKSPITQAEKHARHLYHAIYDILPDGDPDYIVPIVCFVDKCLIRDDRSEYFQNYIPVCTLNKFKSTLERYNKPLEYNLDLPGLEWKLNSIQVSIRRTL